MTEAEKDLNLDPHILTKILIVDECISPHNKTKVKM